MEDDLSDREREAAEARSKDSTLRDDALVIYAALIGRDDFDKSDVEVARRAFGAARAFRLEARRQEERRNG